MSKISERAQKILTWIGEAREIPIRQQTLAEHFSCSRRTIGRALKELKEANLLLDIGRRHKNRCKLYQTKIQPVPEETGLTPQAEVQWERYGKTFALVFRMPELQIYYAQVTWQLAGIKDESELYRKTFAGLFSKAGTEALINFPIPRIVAYPEPVNLFTCSKPNSNSLKYSPVKRERKLFSCNTWAHSGTKMILKAL